MRRLASALLWPVAIAVRIRPGEHSFSFASPQGVEKPQEPPHFTVDLDAPPQERWKEVILYHRDKGHIEAMMDLKTSPLFPPKGQAMMAAITEAVRPQIDAEYSAEIDGLVHYANMSGVTRDRVIAVQALSEANYPTFCSGLLAAQEDGTVIHGRNLDWWLTVEVRGKTVGWSDLTVLITFLRGGKPFIDSVHWPGQLGIVTALRHGGWSYQENTRRQPEGDALDNLAAMQQGGLQHGLKVRRILEQVPDFEGAVEAIYTAKFAAPHYFTLAGPKPWQGAILSLNRMGNHVSPPTPPIQRLNKQLGIWHILQTNDDWTNPKELYDRDPFIHRRPIENYKLAFDTQKQVSKAWMMKEMRDKPLMMPITAFSAVIVPSENFFKVELPHAWN